MGPLAQDEKLMDDVWAEEVGVLEKVLEGMPGISKP